MYAHSVKNPNIIHFKKTVRRWLHDDEYHYLCCDSYTPSKATTDLSKVTCQNCLRLLANREEK